MRSYLLGAVLLVASLAAAGCGDDDDSAPMTCEQETAFGCDCGWYLSQSQCDEQQQRCEDIMADPENEFHDHYECGLSNCDTDMGCDDYYNCLLACD